MAPPGCDENLGFLQGVKDLSVQELVAQPRAEALDVPGLPGRAQFDEGGPGADRGDPLPDRFGDELRAVVGTDVGRDAAQNEQGRTNRAVRTSMTSADESFLRARIAKLSRVNPTGRTP